MSFRIFCCYSTNCLGPLVRPSPTSPNVNPTPSTSTTNYQSVSTSTAGAIYNEEKKTHNADSYHEYHHHHLLLSLLSYLQKLVTFLSLSSPPLHRDGRIKLAATNMCQQSYTATSNDRPVHKYDIGAGGYRTCVMPNEQGYY